jgi:nitrite reductase/ring-hydroxylating ferredoxin subunit/uncharacterized membrane protein
VRSRASFLGHSIHAAIIPFPFAFLWGAAVFDLAGRLAGRPTLWTTGAYLALAGVAMALVASVPGLIDYLVVVPPKSSGKRRATKHLIVNLSSVALFAGAWWIRGDADAIPSTLQLAIELLAVVLLTIGGWLGGSLVTWNQIGIDRAYAHGGSWSEESFRAEPGEPLVVAKADDLEPNQMKLLHVDGRRIVLARTEEGYVAFDDRCTHEGGSLADGTMICGRVQCPWHGSQFDVATGKVASGPARAKIATYQVERRRGEILLRL